MIVVWVSLSVLILLLLAGPFILDRGPEATLVYRQAYRGLPLSADPIAAAGIRNPAADPVDVAGIRNPAADPVDVD